MEILDRLINEYSASDDTAQVVNELKVALLVGITGAGKDTLKKQLLAKSGYNEIISHTTRLPRSNSGVMEIDGQDYHFIDTDTAVKMLENQEFIEAKLVHGTVVYGTSLNELKRAGADGAVAVTDVDVQGVAEYKQLSQSVIALFIIPPSYAIWLERLQGRYDNEEEFKAEWPKRRDSAIQELEFALSVPYFHFVLNDDLGRAVRVSDEIIQRGDTYLQKDDEARLMARSLLSEIKEQL